VRPPTAGTDAARHMAQVGGAAAAVGGAGAAVLGRLSRLWTHSLLGRMDAIAGAPLP